MKLRIQGNSLRIRIKQQELADLHEQGRIMETVTLGMLSEDRLEYALEVGEQDQLSVDYAGRRISVQIPEQVISELVNTDRVGISAQLAVHDGETLMVLVEKDFKCLTPRVEDKDAFPHPEVDLGHQC